jgi:hypothetical protein
LIVKVEPNKFTLYFDIIVGPKDERGNPMIDIYLEIMNDIWIYYDEPTSNDFEKIYLHIKKDSLFDDLSSGFQLTPHTL